ncbi:hypothetical protein [Muricomes intestini]|jgi:hypothetical protein|uniref:hypothetical protein n=1 Tax=Muricomes intestini TaxID=1796634 RepID=UPI002FE2F80B
MRIKYSIIGKLANLTNVEWDFLLYIGRYQDRMGCVEGVYYRDVMRNTGMCKQSFYNALEGLETKKIISYCKNSEIDYDIRILDNEFPTQESFKEGYIKLNRKIFRATKFLKLKAKEKFLTIEFLKITHENASSYQKQKDDFFDKYCRMLGVTRRVIRGYLHHLRKLFSIGIKDGKYFITYLHTVFKDDNRRSQELQHFDHLIKKECQRRYIQYDQQTIQDTAKLIQQYRQEVGGTKEMLLVLGTCIESSVSQLKKQERYLKPDYIHKLVRIALDLPSYAS